MTELTPFKIMGDMNKGIIYTKEEVASSGLNIFLLLQFIRTNQILISVARYLNKNYKMNIYDSYLFVFYTFKRFKIKNVSWTSGKKMKKPEDVTMLMNYYKVNYMIANRYLDSLDKKKIKEIKDYLDVGGLRKGKERNS